MMKKAVVLTFGCQMNEHDSQRMGSLLESTGYKVVPCSAAPDMVLINTCSVRGKPEQKLSQLLSNLKKDKNQNPNMKIIVAGCVAQQKGEDLIHKFPFVDVVIGPDGEEKLLEYLNQINKGGSVIDINFNNEFSYAETLVMGPSHNSHAYVTVVKGCDSFCSYCIVPYVRGRERSRAIKEIKGDVKGLVKKGISSVTLLGQNIARFGKDNNEDFPSLLNEISQVDGLKRLSFLTSHPKDFSKKIIRCFEELPNLCPMLHLPAQHGSNKILKAMNRGYTREQYLDIIAELRSSKVWDKLSLTTDIIIGFPTEDENDFKDLMDLLERADFDNSYSFIYSPRPKTKAVELFGDKEDKINRPLFTKRLLTYQERQKQIALKKNKKLEGATLEVLVEGPSQKDPSKLTGRISSGKVVNFIGDKNIFPGSYVMVKIIKAHPTHLSGEVL